MIICDDADLAKAASAASMGRFYNCGQACLAIKRVYVFESVADEVIEAIAAKAAQLRIGIGSDPESQIGPLHSERQRDGSSARSPTAAARSSPAAARPDDPALANGWFHEPTVVLEPGRDSPMARRRCSGRRCRSGACATWTRRSSAPTTRRSASAPRSGRATSTAPSAPRPSSTAATRGSTRATKVYDELPFGGLKASGYGKEHGSEAFDFYTDKKSVVVRRA